MHKEILTSKQVEVLPLIQKFSKNFGLVGGTAVALHIGHRESIDFDLFSMEDFDNGDIRRVITKDNTIQHVLRDEKGQYTMIVNGVSITFLHYPFDIDFLENFEDIIKIPDLLTLAAMKAYALGRRVKWKDYVDLYFIMEKYHSMREICDKSADIFGNEFNEKIFREQLAYFEDVDYSEDVIFKEGFFVADDVIKERLVTFSLE